MTSEQGSGWKVAAIDEIPPVKDDWPATWKSVRHHFGITSFGVNAVTKDEDKVLIPEHDHAETGEQELYVVLAGEATATLDGEQVQVPAGSAVGVEGGTRRKFESAASPTTLMVIGGTPGQAYEIGEWEQ
jgi:mannose-6-phosphate isomerase-like protein (cupin superfamily)